jgi:ATP-binding cassette subfamily A (ABC1) protein 3
MSKYSHFSALIKKNLLISKSTFVLTIVELFSPIVIMLLLWGLKTLFTKENLEFQDDVDYLVSNSSLLTNTFNPIIFDEISYRGFIYMCSNRPLIAFVGENFPENLAKKVKNHNWEFRNVKFRNYNNLEDLLNYVESKDYGADNNLYPKLCFALSYKNEANKYLLKLHYFANPYRSNPPDIPSTEIGVGNPLNLQPDFNSFGKYIQSGFFMSQKIFYDYVLQEETNNQNAEITYTICPKKYDKYISDAFVRNISLLLGFFTIVAYALPLTINIYRIVKEKETRAKEGMKIMGLSELTYFLSYFVIYFIINLFYSIVNALILKNVLIFLLQRK